MNESWQKSQTSDSPMSALANANWVVWPRKPLGGKPPKSSGPMPKSHSSIPRTTKTTHYKKRR